MSNHKDMRPGCDGVDAGADEGSMGVDQLLTMDEAADLLGVSRRKLERDRRRGLLPDRPLLTLAEVRHAPVLRLGVAAEHVERSPHTLRRWITQGRLHAILVGREWRTSLADVEAALAGSRREDSSCRESVLPCTSAAPVLAPTTSTEPVMSAAVLSPPVPNIQLEAERSVRQRPGGWLQHRLKSGELLRVVVPHRVYLLLMLWLSKARLHPDQPVMLSLREIALALSHLAVADDARAGRRVTFATLHETMKRVRRALKQARLKPPRSLVHEQAYEFPPLMKCALPGKLPPCDIATSTGDSMVPVDSGPPQP